MKIYLGIKYHSDHRNKIFVESLCRNLAKNGHEMFCVAKDLEHWGQHSYPPSVLMQKTFEVIDNADLVLIELSEKGVGLGIEAGYATAKKKRIVTALNFNAELSATLEGISEQVIRYENVDDLSRLLTEFNIKTVFVKKNK